MMIMVTGGGHPLLNALRRKLVALLHRDVLSEQIRLKLPVSDTTGIVVDRC
jgi:hypothetical protein